MNRSRKLEDTDKKPLFLCSVCFRKLNFYLRFGDEFGYKDQIISRYKELIEVFKLMNQNDNDLNFNREIKLMQAVTLKIKQVDSQNLDNNNELSFISESN